jgi:hypothetical protein
MKLRNRDPYELAETDPARIETEIILENARRLRDYGKDGQVEPLQGSRGVFSCSTTLTSTN